MSRLLVLLLVVLVVLIGGVVLLSSRDTSQEPVRMEKVVPLDNLAN